MSLFWASHVLAHGRITPRGRGKKRRLRTGRLLKTRNNSRSPVDARLFLGNKIQANFHSSGRVDRFPDVGLVMEMRLANSKAVTPGLTRAQVIREIRSSVMRGKYSAESSEGIRTSKTDI